MYCVTYSIVYVGGSSSVNRVTGVKNLALPRTGCPISRSFFREMWDSTALRLVSLEVVKGRPTVAPHISRKTREIWGTRLLGR